MSKPPKLDSVRHVRSRGKWYSYFTTGRKDALGNPVRVPLPHYQDPSFYQSYAAMMGHKHKTKGEAFSDLVESYFKSDTFGRLAKASQKAYRIYIGGMVEHLGDFPASDIIPADVRAAYKVAKLSNAQWNLTTGALRGLFKYARQHNLIRHDCDPMKDIELLSMGEHEPWPLKAVQDGLKSPTVSLAVHLLYYTGQRVSDVVKMRWNDIANGKIAVKQQKTGLYLNIDMHPALVSELARHERKAMTILCDGDGKPLKTDTVRRLIDAFGKEHGLKIVPHGLRKNAVNALLEAGCTPYEVGAVTGQSPQTIEHYAKRRDRTVLSEGAILKWRAK